MTDTHVSGVYEMNMGPSERCRVKPPCAEGKTMILLLPTVRCQLNCPYCQWHFKGNSKEGGTLTMAGGATWDIGPEQTAEQWLEWLKPYAPWHIEVSGGEPTLWKPLNEFLTKMPEGCTWAITTNGLEIPITAEALTRCAGYSVSFHLPYARLDAQYVKQMYSNATKLMRRGAAQQFKFSIVATPDLLDDLERFVSEMRKWGHAVHINPAALTDVDWAKQEAAYHRMEDIAGTGLLKYPYKWELFRKPGYCSAGDSNYFFLMPDGNVLRCHSQIYWKDSEPIGHISDWKPEDTIRPCGRYHLWVCDDRATVYGDDRQEVEEKYHEQG